MTLGVEILVRRGRSDDRRGGDSGRRNGLLVLVLVLVLGGLGLDELRGRPDGKVSNEASIRDLPVDDDDRSRLGRDLAILAAL